MHKDFHIENRNILYSNLDENSAAILYSGQPPRKTADEYYPFFANRNFVYMTGIEQSDSMLLARIHGGGLSETLFVPPSNPHIERWSGKRVTAPEAFDMSGIADIRH